MRRFPAPLKAAQYGRSAPPGKTRSEQEVVQGSDIMAEAVMGDIAKCGDSKRRRVERADETEAEVVPVPLQSVRTAEHILKKASYRHRRGRSWPLSKPLLEFSC